MHSCDVFPKRTARLECLVEATEEGVCVCVCEDTKYKKKKTATLFVFASLKGRHRVVCQPVCEDD